MKLINFLNIAELNEVREKMQAPLVEWDPNTQWSSFDPLNFRETLRAKGEVDIPFSELNVDRDGTFSLYGERVLVYMREQRMKYFARGYRFHVVDCSHLKTYRANGRYGLYVASIRTDGAFHVNLIKDNGDVETGQTVELKVCMKCLAQLDYKRFNRMPQRQKELIRDEFNIDEFFKSLPKSRIKKPKHSNATAPLNNYTFDFDTIASQRKKELRYMCEQCSIDLTKHKRYLHVHHIDGVKSNNHVQNLRVLCIDCHAEQPGHGHMKSHPDYRDFKKDFSF